MRDKDNLFDSTEVRVTDQFQADLAAMIAHRTTDLSIAESAAVGALPSGAALLIVRRGSDLGARFLLDQDITTAGRNPKADIFLDDVTVSRSHAEFVRRGTKFSVVDKGSLNGTYCNCKRIESEIALQDGDEVQVGKYRFTFFASRFDIAKGA
ncbi:FHA domain-containing protein [Canibacter sp. lx-72]|uniref:FHA domain-containing protein n=1 Tax=Canibacter zhuwentaonis TaxID=2837491 RepID=UPI001BDC6B94|nr:FHA domain-containing protein [Canibacter zhuwentaonis]